MEGFFKQNAVKFVHYDENMYNFCSVGETTHDKDGKLVTKTKKDCAKASDWYDVTDQIAGRM
jgi:hypothetical protein